MNVMVAMVVIKMVLVRTMLEVIRVHATADLLEMDELVLVS